MISDLTRQVEESFCFAEDFPAQVKIVTVNLLDLQKKLDQMSHLNKGECFLSRKEREKFIQFRYRKRKIEWLGGRIAAKYAGWKLHGHGRESQLTLQNPEWHETEIVADQNGKPFLYAMGENICKEPEISISHSKGIAVGLAAWKNCGVDIQQITSSLERVRTRFVTDGETKIVNKISQSFGMENALALLWSAKEAVKKTRSNRGLPGFLDIEFREWTKRGKGGLLRVISEKNSANQFEHNVWAGFVDGYSFALTLRNEEKK